MLRLGIIGCGRVTTMFHLKAIEEVDGLAVVAVADRNEARLNKVRKRARIKRGYLDYRELLSDPEIDAVVINTPPRFHEEMVLRSLKSKKHVLCEKPLASSVDGCIHIRRVKEATGLVVLPGHNYVFTPCLDKSLELLQGGVIGEVQKISLTFENNLRSYRSKTDFRLKTKTGIVDDVLSHILSVAHKLAGNTQKVESIKAWRKSYDVIDNLNLILETERGVFLNCFMSWTSIIPSFKIETFGGKGNIKMELMRSPFSVDIESDIAIERINLKKGLGKYLDLLRLKHPSFEMQYHHLYNLIEGLEEPKITLNDEIKIISVIKEVVKRLSNNDYS